MMIVVDTPFSHCIYSALLFALKRLMASAKGGFYRAVFIGL